MSCRALEIFHEPVSRWFEQALGAPTHAQELAWPVIRSGVHSLVVAPTGSGKTLAAFLAAIDAMMFDEPPPASERCRLLYISPLKALAVDIERNLLKPLHGIAESAKRLSTHVHIPRIAVRTGDTPARERRNFVRSPADIFITTPESLYLVLTSLARETLRSVRWVIVDEVHAIAGSKRGTHLALSLERLEELTRPLHATGPQRIGLSATVHPLDEIARFIAGYDDGGQPRHVQVVDAGSRKPLELTVAAPERSGFRISDSKTAEQGIWRAIPETLLEYIREHRSTLIFVNNRRTAERLAEAINELVGGQLARAHHGSLARERRREIEEDLKAGKLRALVATSSLELGIDMGAIDLVVQIEAPPSIASGMQRIGRAGHHVDTPSKGVILPKHRGDLLACAAAAERMHAAAVETMRYPRNPLDVLAQQITAMVSMDVMTVDDVERIVHRAAPYHDLPRALLEDVLDMLSGRYPSRDFADLRPRLFWNRLDGTLTARENARRVAISSGGTIPNRGQYGVFLQGVPPAQGRVGELEEIMVFESRIGDVFILGASSWQIVEITPDRVLVQPAQGRPGRMPFWHGDAPGRPVEFGRAIGALARTLRTMPDAEALELLRSRHDLTDAAARDLMDFLRAQERAAGAVPDDRTIVVERHRDEMGEWRVCILTPLGSRVLAPWAMAIGATLRERTGLELDVLWTEDGMVLRFPDAEQPPSTEWLIPDPDEVEHLVSRQLAFGGGAARKASFGAPVTAVFASHFREAAARALLLPQRSPGKRSPLWLTRKRAADLLHVVSRFPDFPIVLETFRECLQDVFDMPALVDLLRQVRDGTVRVVTVDTASTSPFAASLLFSYAANFMYEGDAPLAERRAYALAFDPVRLRQLMGEADMRELLDAGVLRDTESALQHLTPDRAASSKDDVHDMLLHLGDLSSDEVAARCRDAQQASAWLGELEASGRILPVTLAGERRWIAAEDASRYRDALAVPLPSQVSAGSLCPVPDPLGDILARYARTHGPFTTAEVAARLGLGPATAREVLKRLEAEGRLVEGEFRPAGTGTEWCDREVLQTLRRRSLARWRREVEPVDHQSFVRYLLEWHGIIPEEPIGSRPSLLDVIHRLQGLPLPASQLEADILPLRLPNYDPRDLDMLVATGQVVWLGDGKLGAHDGRVRLYLAEELNLLGGPLGTESPEPQRHSPLHSAILEYLSRAGASFFPAIVSGVRGFAPEVLEALWDLVWSGRVTNDTLQPLRAFVHPEGARRAETYALRREGRFRALPRSQHLGGRPVPSTALGRWSAVGTRPLASDDSQADRSNTTLAWVSQLLDRHGILTRDALATEPLPGGWASLQPVLRAMEDAGRVQRGYFIEGLGASQFALPEAVELLRRQRQRNTAQCAPVLLAALDPASPFGGALPWPSHEDPRGPMRAAGCFVAIGDGQCMAWLSPTEGRMVLFQPSEQALAGTIHAVEHAVRHGRVQPFMLARLDGRPVGEHPIAAVFEQHGYSVGSRGVPFRRSFTAGPPARA